MLFETMYTLICWGEVVAVASELVVLPAFSSDFDAADIEPVQILLWAHCMRMFVQCFWRLSAQSMRVSTCQIARHPMMLAIDAQILYIAPLVVICPGGSADRRNTSFR